jgi:hypothetical protein
MKQLLVRTILLSSIAGVAIPAPSPAQADDATARIAALEKENAALRRENAALRDRTQLRADNAALRKQLRDQEPSPTVDPRQTYAADASVLKAPPPVTRGQFRAWVEGSAIWSGGDPFYSFYTVADVARGDTPSIFALKPKVGWEAATGFDYRFRDSPWHVSAQFRYGEASTSANAAASQTISLPPIFATATQTVTARHKETHGLADFAVGRDVLGSGPDAMQVKVGLRLAELTAKTSTLDSLNELVDFGGPTVISGVTVTNLTVLTTNDTQQKSTFRGAGPRIGAEGAAPLWGGWSFDYLADGAVLFGTHKFNQVNTTAIATTPPIPGFAFPGGSTNSTSKGGTVFNADIQAGVSYWLNPNVKVSASYRLDAYFGALSTLSVENDPSRLTKVDRYFHGPRLALTGNL